MKNKLKRFLKISLITFLILGTVLFALFIAFDNGLFKGFASKKLDENLLSVLNTPIEIYDKDNNLIESDIYIKNLVTIDDLPKYVGDAFIAIEDKDFYKHKGISYKGIARAMLNNIKSGSFAQGGSTISQQLIKNTHLTNKKTLSRKIDEALLTQQLEDKFSKKEILQAYLNAIYFGQGTFGIEKASQKYFSKPAKNLTIAEAATLAGIIKSPLKYSPTQNYNACKSRRNLVLNEMFLAQKITKEELDKSLNEEINLKISKTDLGENNYNNMAIDEASNLLNMPEQELILGGYKIYTYQDKALQTKVENTINSLDYNCDKLSVVLDNKTSNVLAYAGNSKYNLSNKKMQPGSILKPIAVYAPALEEKVVMTSSQILDEKINIGDYSPKNYDNKYHGWVSVKESLAKSYNVPAVKLLEYVGINKSKNYCKKFGLNIDSNKGYSIALGGLKEGVDFLSMANSYTAFANKGFIGAPSFIKCIKNKYGRTIYTDTNSQSKVISEDNAYLMTDMLKESVNIGTAKKLKDISKDNLASKTGTAGSSQGNTDIWNITYSPKYTTAVWFGKTDGKLLPQNFTGGNQTTLAVKSIVKYLGDKSAFAMPRTITKKYISNIDLEEDKKIVLAPENMTDRHKTLALFSSNNIPTKQSNKLINAPKVELSGNVFDDKIVLNFDAKKYIKYEIYRKEKTGDQLVKIIEEKSGKQEITEPMPAQNTVIEYYLKYKISGESSQKYENTVPIKILATKRSIWE